MSGFDEFDEEPSGPRRIDWSLWRRMLVHVRPHWRAVVAMIVLGQLLAAVDLALPLLTAWLVDAAVEGRGMAELTWGWIAYGASALLFACLIWGIVAVAGRLASGVGHDLRRAGFARLQELSFGYFDRRPVGWLVSRVTSDCGKVSGLLPWFSLDMTWGPALALGVTIAMFVVDPVLAAWVLTIVPALAVTSAFFQRRMLASARAMRRANARITASFGEAVMGVRTTKALVRERGRSCRRSPVRPAATPCATPCRGRCTCRSWSRSVPWVPAWRCGAAASRSSAASASARWWHSCSSSRCSTRRSRTSCVD